MQKIFPSSSRKKVIRSLRRTKKIARLIFGLEKDLAMILTRQNDEGMVNKCYLGGRNNISQYHKNNKLKAQRKIAIDIDFPDAYSTAFGLIPLTNWNEKIRRNIPLEKYTEGLVQQYNEVLHFTKIGFFETWFKFPDRIFEPSLPQKTKWGLIYTKKEEL